MKLWIRVEADVGGNAKVHQLARFLRIPLPSAVGHLVMFWGGVAAHRTAGDLKGVLPETLEEWARWRGQPGRFAVAVRRLFIKDGILHGWGERQGKLILRQIDENLQQQERRRRARMGVTADSQPSDGLQTAVSQPSLRARNATKTKPRGKRAQMTNPNGNDPESIGPVMEKWAAKASHQLRT